MKLKSHVILQLSKLIGGVAANEISVSSISVSSEPCFITYQPIGGPKQYRTTGPTRTTITIEVETL